MSKSKKQSVSNEVVVPRMRRYAVQLPEVMNMDDVGCLLDEDLNARMYALETDRSKAYDLGVDTLPWEVEACYVRREQMIRRQRREAHERYMREQSQLFANEEMNLPSADFDNMKFIELN